MDLRRVVRLSAVLVASQMRAGRSNSDPRSFFGRPVALAVADAVAFAVVSLGTYEAAQAIVGVDRALLAQLAPLLLAFLPLLALGVLLIAGVMFELSATARFAASDAANWLPISPTEYVLASSLAASFSYSLVLSFALGVGLGVAVASGLVAAFLLTAAVSAVSLLLGGLLIEMLRASTQRLSTVVARRTGRATLVLRVVLFLVVILVFEAVFNPVFLFSLLEGYANIGPLGTLIPFLWASRAVQAFVTGQPLLAAALAGGHVLLTLLALGIAVELRSRFWVPVAAELKLQDHAYAEAHPVLRALGLSVPEATLASKDFRGLVRRRELLPLVVTPLVLAIFSAASAVATPSGATAKGVSVGVFVTWIPGFFSLLLASASFAQERRAITMLFALPLSRANVFRAKLAVALLPPLAFGAIYWVAGETFVRWPLPAAVALLFLALAAALTGAFLGLVAAARWSDFQDRPRPQFVRPLPMLGIIGLGSLLSFGTGLPVLFWGLAGGSLSPAALLSVAVPAAVLVVLLPVLFVMARRSADRFLEQVPV